MSVDLLAFSQTVGRRPADPSVREPCRLQPRPSPAENGVHSLGLGPLLGERRVSGRQRQAFGEEEVQKQAFIGQR